MTKAPEKLPADNVFAHLWRGFCHGYPPCCVLTYALGRALRARNQASRRGIIHLGYRPNGATHRWVPCMWHRYRHPRWRPRLLVLENELQDAPPTLLREANR